MINLPRIVSTEPVLPQHRYPQQQLTDAFADFVGVQGLKQGLLRKVHGNAGVQYRHLALPIEKYADLHDFDTANDAFINEATALTDTALRRALEHATVEPGEVELIMTATTTGLAVPSLEARIAPAAGIRSDVKRLPVVGLGCVAGAAGVARVADYLLGHPDAVAVLLSVELCSLTLQRADTSTANLIASGLFGDGAAAVVMAGARRAAELAPGGLAPSGPAPRVVAGRSHLYPHTERAMGWDVGASGLRIVLGAEIPDLVRSELRADVDGFLGDHGLSVPEIDFWVCHPGGPKVLQAVEETLDLRDGQLDVTWESLTEIGNISSASVLHVLADTLRHRTPRPGSYGLMLALGPGFSLEMVLLQV
ncbi:type III polyketide synthase [Microlunatus elymi]|uniref:Type III polyketide synthase n=1 Tax=Microlunatus elymi TaxID=2596828 RepID=A0A516Q228_9ACTN|nr:3-oxoacyl-[acyl-carrier-protein] synthase III C-terminal domain-containing protein [Microlunatus elymi]QDP97477.1 type III polyketide synthase [Microlunatus elymi]